jgi:hypothetical protein
MIDVTGVAERHECEHSEILVLGAPQRGFGKVTARQIAQWRLGSCNLPSMDGNFAVIARDKRDLTVSVWTDNVASVRILASQQDNMIRLSDRWSSVDSRAPDLQALAHLLGIGQLLGQETLVEGVRTLRPSTLTVFGPHGLLREEPLQDFDRRRNQTIGQLVDCLRDVAASYRGRRVLLPLSGGWDSRLLFALFLEAGVEFETFSIGGIDHPGSDHAIAASISAAYGIPCHFVASNATQVHETADELNLRAGGECPDFLAYSDGMAGLRALARNFDVIVRGDEAFGWLHMSLTPQHARRMLGLEVNACARAHVPALAPMMAVAAMSRYGARADEEKNLFYLRERLPHTRANVVV